MANDYADFDDIIGAAVVTANDSYVLKVERGG